MRVIAMAGALVLLSPILRVADVSGQSASPQGEQPRFNASTQAVVVDVVVRDKGGRPIPALRAGDFELFEDGARQQITSFEFVDFSIAAPRPNRSSAETHSDSPASRDAGNQAAIALVFEELSPEGRRLAYNAASAFVESRIQSSDSVGVFTIRRALRVLAPYTRNIDAIRSAIADASLTPGYAIERAGQVPGAEFGTPEAGQVSQATKDDSPYARAHATFYALERLIASMPSVPGRKAVVLFSQGFALGPSKDDSVTRGMHDYDHWLSDNRHDHFTRVIQQANRARISFYTFDAAGLRIDGPLVDACFGCPPYVGLQFLADETGGVFVENTNDLVAGVWRVAADLRQYYLLGYTSTNSREDGKYRRITVKVRQRGVTVLARKGYFARVDSRR
jgi:VWFA-related protein